MKIIPIAFGREGEIKMLCLVSESEEESNLIDEYLGDRPFDADGVGPVVKGEVRLSDGYADHYIRLERSV